MKSKPFLRIPCLLLVTLFLTGLCRAVIAPRPPPQAGKSEQVTFVHCGTLIDEVSDQPRQNVLVEIAGGKFRAITNYTPGFAKPAGAAFIDLAIGNLPARSGGYAHAYPSARRPEAGTVRRADSEVVAALPHHPGERNRRGVPWSTDSPPSATWKPKAPTMRTFPFATPSSKV